MRSRAAAATATVVVVGLGLAGCTSSPHVTGSAPTAQPAPVTASPSAFHPPFASDALRAAMIVPSDERSIAVKLGAIGQITSWSGSPIVPSGVIGALCSGAAKFTPAAGSTILSSDLVAPNPMNHTRMVIQQYTLLYPTAAAAGADLAVLRTTANGCPATAEVPATSGLPAYQVSTTVADQRIDNWTGFLIKAEWAHGTTPATTNRRVYLSEANAIVIFNIVVGLNGPGVLPDLDALDASQTPAWQSVVQPFFAQVETA